MPLNCNSASSRPHSFSAWLLNRDGEAPEIARNAKSNERTQNSTERGKSSEKLRNSAARRGLTSAPCKALYASHALHDRNTADHPRASVWLMIAVSPLG